MVLGNVMVDNWITAIVNLPLNAPAITTNNTTIRFAKVKRLFAIDDSFAPNARAAEKFYNTL